jgi:copper ion binding protein
MKTETFKVSGMMCSHCEKNVENAVKAIAGVKDVKADRAAGNITVEYDTATVSPADIKAAVDDVGSYELTI